MKLSRREFLEQAARGAVAIAVPALASCDDNQPSEPIVTVPNPPTNLQTTESLRYVALTWNAPETNTDGSPLVDLQSYQVYRRRLPESEFRFAFEVERSGTIFIDASVGASEVAYRVVAKTRRGAASEPSEPSSNARAQLVIRSSDVPLVGERRLYDASGAQTQAPTNALASVERMSASAFLALELICTHAGCGGMNFENGLWTCRCHGSRFDSQGNVAQSPATEPLRRLSVGFSDGGGLTLRAS